eukprot:scaffold3876_cov344-Prasinococcus_capsulatus_cf.AAC.9
MGSSHFQQFEAEYVKVLAALPRVRGLPDAGGRWGVDRIGALTGRAPIRAGQRRSRVRDQVRQGHRAQSVRRKQSRRAHLRGR